MDIVGRERRSIGRRDPISCALLENPLVPESKTNPFYCAESYAKVVEEGDPLQVWEPSKRQKSSGGSQNRAADLSPNEAESSGTISMEIKMTRLIFLELRALLLMTTMIRCLRIFQKMYLDHEDIPKILPTV